MTIIDHAITRPQPGHMQRRIVWLLFAGLLQVALVYALIVGLDIKIQPFVDHRVEGEVILDRTRTPLPPPEPTRVIEPTQVTVVKPTIEIAGDGMGRDTAITAVTGPVTGGPVAVAARSIMSTHTKPPYPRLSLLLGEQGTVVLRLTISAQGTVQAATVVRSSGYGGLDEAAQAWVVRHWRYKPATMGGQPVASTADVAVQFDLRNAG